MFNNGKAPFDDKLAREAVAHGVDQATLVKTLFGDVFATADGPFSPGSRWYAAPTAAEQEQKQFDPALAKQLAQQYEKKHGKPLTFTLNAPASITEAARAAQLTQSYLKPLGIHVKLNTEEFAKYVLDAVQGNYEADIWRQFGEQDPDGDYVWWHPRNVQPVGAISLNIARFSNADMGKALDLGRSSSDLATRKQAYAQVQQIFRDNYYFAWTAHAFWAVGSNPQVHDLVYWKAPDGEQGLPVNGGVHPLAQIWVKSTG